MVKIICLVFIPWLNRGVCLLGWFIRPHSENFQFFKRMRVLFRCGVLKFTGDALWSDKSSHPQLPSKKMAYHWISRGCLPSKSPKYHFYHLNDKDSLHWLTTHPMRGNTMQQGFYHLSGKNEILRPDKQNWVMEVYKQRKNWSGIMSSLINFILAPAMPPVVRIDQKDGLMIKILFTIPTLPHW